MNAGCLICLFVCGGMFVGIIWYWLIGCGFAALFYLLLDCCFDLLGWVDVGVSYYC